METVEHEQLDEAFLDLLASFEPIVPRQSKVGFAAVVL
jgi:hypothetical protein